jgi:hypothetical protein
MLQTIRRFSERVTFGTSTYAARVIGERRLDGRYVGRLVFLPVGRGPVLVTGVETTQSHFDALQHWAARLSPIYLDGALARAIARRQSRVAARAGTSIFTAHLLR